MEKICFAVVACLLCFINQAKEDLYGDFLLIECNQDLELGEISHYRQYKIRLKNKEVALYCI